LSNLCFLDIANNQLQKLPNTLVELRLLAENDVCYISQNMTQYNAGLIWDGNSLSSLPKDVLDRGTVTILAFLEDESWWHRERLIKFAAPPIAGVAVGIMGLRWYQRRRKSKSKRKNHAA
jgi:hypothetical protein